MFARAPCAARRLPEHEVAWTKASDGGAQERQRIMVERNVTRKRFAREEIDPVGEVMISGLRAIAALRESTLSEQVKALSTDDQNLKVRQAAIETLKAFG